MKGKRNEQSLRVRGESCADPSLLGGSSTFAVLLCRKLGARSSWGHGQGPALGGSALQWRVTDFVWQPGPGCF